VSTIEAILFVIKPVVHTTIYIGIGTDPYYNEIVANISSISHSVDITGKQFISTESQFRNPEIEVE